MRCSSECTACLLGWGRAERCGGKVSRRTGLWRQGRWRTGGARSPSACYCAHGEGGVKLWATWRERQLLLTRPQTLTAHPAVRPGYRCEQQWGAGAGAGAGAGPRAFTTTKTTPTHPQCRHPSNSTAGSSGSGSASCGSLTTCCGAGRTSNGGGPVLGPTSRPACSPVWLAGTQHECAPLGRRRAAAGGVREL